MSTQSQIIRAIAEVLEIPADDIRPTDHFIHDLGATSLDIVNLVWRVEEIFALTIPEAALERISTVGDLVALIEPVRSDEPSEAGESVDVVLASDHAGIVLKSELIGWLRMNGHTVLDLGPGEPNPVDYPDFAHLLGRKIAHGEATFGVLVCGSGIGMSIAANKVHGLRAAVVTDPVCAGLSRRHNNANVLCLGARIIGTDMAVACLEAFLHTAFDPGDDGRHQRRVQRIAEIEKAEHRSL